MDLSGKIAIVTGANSGMGMATSAALSNMGATVIMLCRNYTRGQTALNELMKFPGRNLDLMLCDLGDFDSIRNFVAKFKEKYSSLDLLVNNAGFISIDRRITKNGLEMQFGVNHIGHFLLTNLLLDSLNSGARIVNVASGAHKTGKIHFEDINLTRGFNVIKAYSQSKLANVLFTRELASRLKEKNISVNCCHPGAVATSIGVDRDTGFGRIITGMLRPFFQTPAQGASTAIYLASDDNVKDITGEYFYKCKIAKSSKRSKDMSLAKKLYDFSWDLINS